MAKIAPTQSTLARWKVGRVNAIEKVEISGSAAVGIENISDSFPIHCVNNCECTGESDLFIAIWAHAGRLKNGKSRA
jgi:hypothetical protein